MMPTLYPIQSAKIHAYFGLNPKITVKIVHIYFNNKTQIITRYIRSDQNDTDHFYEATEAVIIRLNKLGYDGKIVLNNPNGYHLTIKETNAAISKLQKAFETIIHDANPT